MNREVDRYIAAAAPFARPILEKIRAVFHKAHPAVTETIKWGVPHFEHKGVIGSMAAFKNHVTWGFRKAALMSDPAGIFAQIGQTGMGGARVVSLTDLPAESVLVDYVRGAIRLNESGKKIPRTPRVSTPPADLPPDFAAALQKSPAARANFDRFPPSHRREYVEWITEAKQPATREKRLATAIEWITDGKQRNWKYVKAK